VSDPKHLPEMSDTTEIQITVNGGARRVRRGLPLGALVRELTGGERPGVAAALNGEIVRRAEWPTQALGDGDEVEIVTASQGG
jgi:sulfur carrier protein